MHMWRMKLLFYRWRKNRALFVTWAIAITTPYATTEFVISIEQCLRSLSLKNVTDKNSMLEKGPRLPVKALFFVIVCYWINECYTWIVMHVNLPHTAWLQLERKATFLQLHFKSICICRLSIYLSLSVLYLLGFHPLRKYVWFSSAFKICFLYTDYKT